MTIRSKSSSTRAVLYLRTSTAQTQDTENQRPDLEQIARARGLEVVDVYEEQASAFKTRPRFERMMKDARLGAFSVAIIWALDRFGRSMVGNIQALLELDRLGIKVISARESWLDTSSPVRSLLIAIFSWVAEQEGLRIRERTVAGLDRARRKGVRLGRPAAHVNLAAVEALRREGLKMPAIAKKLGVSPSTLYKVVAAGRVSENHLSSGRPSK